MGPDLKTHGTLLLHSRMNVGMNESMHSAHVGHSHYFVPTEHGVLLFGSAQSLLVGGAVKAAISACAI